MQKYSENALIEQPTIKLFASLGWQTADCFNEFEQPGGSPLGRETKGEVVLVGKLRKALKKLNPGVQDQVIESAIEELTRDRSAMSMVAANREIYKLLKDGVKISIHEGGNEEQIVVVKVIDWNNSSNNDFFLASQFWITGEMYTRRADLVGFVNGLPLVFIELKASHKRLENAFEDNLTDYKDTIPQIFWYNAFVIISNGSNSKIGSITAQIEHFSDWKRINDEGEKGIISLETMIRGTCEKERLINLIENYVVFMEAQGGMIKLLGKNHQYLGVENAINSLKKIKDKQGRLGVFWHTQGSGKSVSMIMFAQKVLRKIPGNWTFVVVTDRQELDNQIYKNFVDSGAVTEKNVQADSCENLRALLSEDHRYVFTLIHKFRTETGEKHPVVSTRNDIIVITDEAHRTQYDTLALNMRTALPNASFIAFTGTPLIVGEEKTKEVFGDYVSIYDFKQSIDDEATVPLYYENRIPELQIMNDSFNEEIEEILEEAELDERQERRLETELSRQYYLITRDQRLETVSKDIVDHFTSRGFKGKAMVVSIDKATAIKMYDKVKKHWTEKIAKLEKELSKTYTKELNDEITFMKTTDMAVVVSSSQNEIRDMAEKGLDIATHRKRMVSEDLATKFKDPADPFRIVFVCAMWMTGFDVPSCSTIYLDKPMKNHTLMQTIARANRVFRDKVNGLIVDYIGVFRNLQKALAIYAPQAGAGANPVMDKSILVKKLQEIIGETKQFMADKGIDIVVIHTAKGFEKVKLLDDAVDLILVNEQSKKHYLLLAAKVNILFRAILPDRIAENIYPDAKLIVVIANKIRSLIPPADISSVMKEIEQLLEGSITAEGYLIADREKDKKIDLSRINFEKLREKFEKGRKRTETEKLKAMLEQKLMKMVAFNRTRIDYLDKFQKLIDEYNAGSMNIEEFFRQLMDFAKDLDEEDKRSISEQLSEEELSIFDLLTKPEMKLTKAEILQVKKVSTELLKKLKAEKLVIDWRRKQQTRADVKVMIEEIFDQLPDAYTKDIYSNKCSQAYEHIYDCYYGEEKSLYSVAAV